MNQSHADSQSGQIDISVIIVNWNTKDLLKNSLASVYQTINNQVFEAIVVDNGSSDGSLEILRRDFSQAIVISNAKNKGFGAANNQAFAVMKGKYALLLNTDAVLTAGAVAKVYDFAEKHDDAAIVCGQLLNADGSKQNSIAAFPGLIALATNVSLLEYLFPQKFPSKKYQHDHPLEVDSAIGACMLIRKKALDETGGFDERYFFFFEETDLAYALHRAGWKTYHVPDAFIYHLQGQSIGSNVRSRIEFYRSRYQFLRKWHNPVYYFVARLIIFARLVVNWVVNLLLNVLTLGLAKKIRQKFVVYSRLILWHLKSDVKTV